MLKRYRNKQYIRVNSNIKRTLFWSGFQDRVFFTLFIAAKQFDEAVKSITFLS